MVTRFVSKARQGARILLIDDNCSGLRARQSVLEELGYLTEGLCDPKEALAACESHEYDLVITDYRLPEMNGVEFIAELRQRNRRIPVILISGYVDALGLTEKTTGADAVIMKSCNEVQHLVRTVGRLLNPSLLRKPAASDKPRGTSSSKTKKKAVG